MEILSFEYNIVIERFNHYSLQFQASSRQLLSSTERYKKMHNERRRKE